MLFFLLLKIVARYLCSDKDVLQFIRDRFLYFFLLYQ